MRKITKVLEKEFPDKVFPHPYRQFVFGRLTFNTNNARLNENGELQVVWDNHVAPIVRITENQNEFYILDPGLSSQPILRNDWIEMMTTNDDTTNKNAVPASITGRVTCTPDTYMTQDNCFGDSIMDDDDLRGFFDSETDAYLELYEIA